MYIKVYQNVRGCMKLHQSLKVMTIYIYKDTSKLREYMKVNQCLKEGKGGIILQALISFVPIFLASLVSFIYTSKMKYIYIYI